MNNLPFSVERIANTPLALHRPAADLLVAALRGTVSPEAMLPISSMDAHREYGLIDGVAILPICGPLSQGNSWWCYSTTYSWVRRGFMAALADPEVKAIVLDIDSPGGECAGLFDLADDIFAARGTKPIWAILNEVAYSAAYALASAADYITVPRTGGTGSIGIVCAHVDWSKALDSAGIAVTFIQYGDRKTDGVPERPLSDDALKRFQADIDTLGELFSDTVARNRGMAASKIRAMQAATFLGQAGVSLGLADAVMAPDAAFSELLASLA